MIRRLDVYLRRQLAGQLIQDEHGQMKFSYAESWLKDSTATPLSHSLPLKTGPFSRNQCRGFFAGVLPEQSQREIIAKNLGISARNDFAMLELIGGECAGAVTFIRAGEALPERNYGYRPLQGGELAAILRQLPRRPLMAGEDGIRLSLAGAQDKIAVHISNSQISLPLGGAPTTHILKPAIERFKGIVFNENFCMKLAQAMGLHAARTQTGKVEDIDYLLVERYDRTLVKVAGGGESLKREHQEDFCQALGIVPENKYQAEGGPSLKQCFALLRELSSAPVIDLQRLLDAVIFNFLVGNHDAHGKNFSLLYGRETRLAPLYDVLSTAYHPELSKKMAMKIGSEYASDEVLPRDFERLAEEAGLARPMVKRRVSELAEEILSRASGLAPEHPIANAVATLIRSRCTRVLEKFNYGAALKGSSGL